MTVWLLVGLQWLAIMGLVVFAERGVSRRRRTTTTHAQPVVVSAQPEAE